MGCAAVGDTALRTFHIDLANIDKVAGILATACIGRAAGHTCILGSQNDFSVGCHLPFERRVLRAAVNPERLVEFVVKHSQCNVACVVGLGLHND